MLGSHRVRLLSLAAAVPVGLMASGAQAQQFLAVDFELNGATETGFQRLSSGNVANATASEDYFTFEGDVTVSTSATGGNQGYFDRGPGLSDNPPTFNFAELYNDFVYDNTGGTIQFVLSGPGIKPNTDYLLTFYSFDRDASVTSTTQFLATPGSNTTGTTGSITYVGTVDPTTDAQYSTTITARSTDNSLEIDADITAGVFNRVNGLQVSLVPEPAGLGVLGLSGLLALRRRRA